jgi:hypothetical protein
MNVEKVWGARYTLGARYLSKNTANTFWLYGFPPSMEKLKHKSVISDNVSLLCSFLFIYHSRECIAAGVPLSEYCTVGRKRPGDVT